MAREAGLEPATLGLEGRCRDLPLAAPVWHLDRMHVTNTPRSIESTLGRLTPDATRVERRWESDHSQRLGAFF